MSENIVVDVEKEIEFIAKYVKVGKKIVAEILSSQDKFFLSIGAIKLSDYAMSIGKSVNDLSEDIKALAKNAPKLTDKTVIQDEDRKNFIAKDTKLLPETIEEVLHFEDMYFIDIGIIDEDEYYGTDKK